MTKSNLPRSVRKRIRSEKARIRGLYPLKEDQAAHIRALYQRLGIPYSKEVSRAQK